MKRVGLYLVLILLLVGISFVIAEENDTDDNNSTDDSDDNETDDDDQNETDDDSDDNETDDDEDDLNETEDDLNETEDDSDDNETDDDEDGVEDDTEDEADDISIQHGAEMRFLQLEFSLKRRIVHANLVIDFLNEKN